MHSGILKLNLFQTCFTILIILVMCVLLDAAAINDPTLSVYYSFDDEAETIKDSSKNGNDAEVVGNANWEDGVIDKAISLQPNVWVDMNGPEFTNKPVDGITLAFWVNHTGAAGSQSIFDAIGTDHASGLYHVELEANGVRWFHRDGTQTTIFSIRQGPPIEPNKWVHFAGIYDSESGDVLTYFDGKEVNSAKGDGKLSDNWGVKAGIGHHNNGRWFTGLLDEFYIFSRALSENEINQLKDGEFLSVDPSDKLTTTWGDIKSFR